MKIIIAGSRSIADYPLLGRVMLAALTQWGLDGAVRVHEVVSGRAPGVDRMGERWAREHLIPVKRMPARWFEYGMSAGAVRNQEMVDYAKPDGGLVALWNGTSTGTRDVIRRAFRAGLAVFVWQPGCEPSTWSAARRPSAAALLAGPGDEELFHEDTKMGPTEDELDRWRRGSR